MRDAQNYSYAIAGMEVTEMIALLEKRAADARQGVEDMAAAMGATVTFEGGEQTPVFDFGVNPLPEGWSLQETDKGKLRPWLHADRWQAIDYYLPLQAHGVACDLQKSFDWACKALAKGDFYNRETGTHGTFSFERLGDKTIIRCPPATNGDIVLPEGCRHIQYEDYLKMKGACTPVETKPPAVRRFSCRF